MSILTTKSCKTQAYKINGVSFVASREAVEARHIDPVVSVNANYAAIMPFGFIKNLEYPEIVHNTDNQWFGETRAGAKQYIDELRKKKIKVMIKPQIWVWRGEFTGYIEMKNEANWKTLEDSYSKFILEYAELAYTVKAELFCIGTELEKFIENRPEFWNTLIKKIRSKYKGKLTYASNWDEFKRTPFWDDLDYIGLDAYFPVSDNKTPSIEECLEGWKTHKNEIYQISQKHNKPILFTEYGYRSVDYTGKTPWVSDRSMNQVNLEAQTNTTQALFETFWDEDWFAGGFIWKWFHKHDKVGGNDNFMFTPQNKPVEALLRNHYKFTNE
ncbi:MAG: glycoside hydrolase [Algibacter sp.]|uniref:glycoside hydrolase family 113 n=1 Tax=Algibacter sp. TaxID=1872428 RepID=UPI00262195E8|nr:glycoside hydrolase [Algibacter sp.]MDG1730161.1 glycoside hydrolase [Algibacter sp.]MDG2179458.1 glycoside hydrolase [Algibacter sp.]